MNERIYLASSWRNARQPAVLEALRSWGHEVYDFRNPGPGLTGFSWKATNPEWKMGDPVTVEPYRFMLDHSIARKGFAADFGAMEWASICVLLLPCGKSAHLELGWCAGAGKRCFVLVDQAGAIEPELMYLVAAPQGAARTVILGTLSELRTALMLKRHESISLNPDSGMTEGRDG